MTEPRRPAGVSESGQSEGRLGTPDSLADFVRTILFTMGEITALHPDWHSKDDSGRAASRTVQSVEVNLPSGFLTRLVHQLQSA